MRPSDQSLLNQLPLHAELGPDVAERLFRNALLQTVRKGAIVFRQGEPAEFLHVLLSGEVALVAEDAALGPTVIEFFPAGEICCPIWFRRRRSRIRAS
jgi:CRP/FNR family transcriptional activator FtrB